MLILNEETTTINNDINTFLNDNGIENPLYTHMETLSFRTDDKTIDCYALAFENNDITNYFHLRDKSDNPLTLSNDGAIITEKLLIY